MSRRVPRGEAIDTELDRIVKDSRPRRISPRARSGPCRSARPPPPGAGSPPRAPPPPPPPPPCPPAPPAGPTASARRLAPPPPGVALPLRQAAGRTRPAEHRSNRGYHPPPRACHDRTVRGRRNGATRLEEPRMNNSPGGTGTAATETRTSAPAPAVSTVAASTVAASTVPASTVPADTVPATTGAASTGAAGTRTPEPLYGGRATRRVTVSDLAKAKARGEKWPMLTAYDALTAHVFDEAGIPVLLVGDSASMVVFGHDSTIPVTLDELIPLTAAVVRGTSRALIVADLPFGSYQASPAAALAAGIRFLKEAGAHAVKLEGGRRVLSQAEELVAAGIPVMGHLGLTPQSVNVFGGYRVQGRGEDGEQLLQDAKALEAAGAFAVVLECVPAELAARVTKAVSIPTIGIGAGPDCDAQVLVWQDMAGLSPRTPKFVKRYADVAGVLGRAAQ